MLGRRALGRAWPNPGVGAVVVRPGRDGAPGQVVGRGWTADGGRPHAETVALARAGAAARGATLYVTLEPCSHYGKTPPCADAVIAAGITRVVACLTDPDARVSGRGFARLREAGIAVETGLMADEAERELAGYLSKRRLGRPFVTVKLATSLDGRIATRTGHSKWITGEAARARAHQLRAAHDAILVGAGTAQADDPLLTVRLPGMPGEQWRQPIRVVLAASADLDPASALARSVDLGPVLVMHAPDAPSARLQALAALGVALEAVARGADGRLEPRAALATLADRGAGSVLVEGGAAIAASFLKAGLVDRLAWFRAPIAIGGDGLPALSALGLDMVTEAGHWSSLSVERLGPDVLDMLQRRE